MLSDEKISHLSHILISGLVERDTIRLKARESEVRKEVKRFFSSETKRAEELDQSVRKKIASLSRQVPEGSPEWEVLYAKYFEEEASRRGSSEG